MTPPELRAAQRSSLAAVLSVVVLTLGACGVSRAPDESAAPRPVEQEVPEWYPDPSPRPGLVRAAASRDARDLRRAVEMADAAARRAVTRLLEEQAAARVSAEARSAGARSAGARGAGADVTSLRETAREAVRALADSARQGDYRIVPHRRGYRAYVLVEASTADFERMLRSREPGRVISP